MVDPGAIEGLWQLVYNQAVPFVFPEAWGGKELFIVFYLIFITYILLKTGADRTSFAFVIVFSIGAFAFMGLIPNPALWGIIIIAGAILTFRALGSLLSE